jgi:hypothetical protein
MIDHGDAVEGSRVLSQGASRSAPRIVGLALIIGAATCLISCERYPYADLQRRVEARCIALKGEGDWKLGNGLTLNQLCAAKASWVRGWYMRKHDPAAIELT